MNRLSYFLMLILTLLTSVSLFAQFPKYLLDGNFTRANGVVSADVDGDGDMDILGSAIDANDIAWWENDGSQTFTKHIIDGNFLGALSVEVADVDGDGDIDVSAAAFSGNETAWWQNDGNQNFTKHIIDAIVATSVYPKDVDGDGDLDFLGASFNDNSISWYANDGNQNFTKHLIEVNYSSPFDAYPVDMDGDSDIDVAGSAGFGNTIDWFENDGDQNFIKHNIANNLNGPRHLFAADVDGDGDIDVLGTQGPANDFSWWENDGSQNFTKHLLDNSIGAAFDIYSADLDDDGDMDIIGASIGPIGILVAWMNDGNQNFTKTVIDGNFPGANCVITADVDTDGYLDILATAEFGNGQLAWYNNLSVPVELTSFTAQAQDAKVFLNWVTATEINNKGFEIYRNGNKIAFVDGKGTTTEKQDYYFIDENLKSGIYNYRLNQLDFDGTQEVVGELTVYLALPEQFSLDQNYPNPFNPSTTIRYAIPNGGLVTIKVYDVLGNEVANLIDEYKSTGSYEVNFNASSLSSGMYLYRLQAGSFVETKKMMLMK